MLIHFLLVKIVWIGKCPNQGVVEIVKCCAKSVLIRCTIDMCCYTCVYLRKSHNGINTYAYYPVFIKFILMLFGKKILHSLRMFLVKLKLHILF